MPEASEPAGAPGSGGGGGGGEQEEYEIRNDAGFVYKVPRGHDVASPPSTNTQYAAGPDPKAAGLRRRRRALLRLRAKRLRALSRWEALASELVAPPPAPQPPPASLPPASSHPDAADAAAASSSASASASILDDLIAKVDIQREGMKKALELCDEVNKLCDTYEAAIVDSIAPVPLWRGNPKELVAGLCSPEEDTAFGNLDEQNVRQEASGASSAAGVKNGVGKKTVGNGFPPPILTESRMRKRVTKLSGSSNVTPQASIGSKRKESGSTSTARGTPGSRTRRKAESTPPRVPGIVRSPGPLTRRMAIARNESPGGL